MFLDPADGGVDPDRLGTAMQGLEPRLIRRVAAALPATAASRFRGANRRRSRAAAVESARDEVMERLFWPLVYWKEPEEYEALIAGEHINPRLLDAIDLDGRVVCDIGAGSGRFTLHAATRARRVIAVDATPALLRRLRANAHAAGIRNVTARRGSFAALPLRDAAVDVAVACSAFTRTGPHGGSRALAEAERIVRPGGDVVVVWPQDPGWLRTMRFEHVAVHGAGVVHFPDVATAERLCAGFYSAAAARWVRRHGSAEVPFSVLGATPPNDLCVKHVTPSR